MNELGLFARELALLLVVAFALASMGAALLLAVGAYDAWKRRRAMRAYLADNTRRRLAPARADDDTGPLTVAGCGDCEEPQCTPEACGASSWRRGGGL